MWFLLGHPVYILYLLTKHCTFCFSLQPTISYRPHMDGTTVQQLCKSCRTCFKFYCMFYFTCDRSLSRHLYYISVRTDCDSEVGGRLKRHNLPLTSVADYSNGLVIDFDRLATTNLAVDERQQLAFHVAQCVLIDGSYVQINRLSTLRSLR